MRVSLREWQKNASRGGYWLTPENISFDKVISLGWVDWKCPLLDIIPKTKNIKRIISSLTNSFLQDNFSVKFRANDDKIHISFSATSKKYRHLNFNITISITNGREQYMLDGPFEFATCDNVQDLERLIDTKFTNILYEEENLI